MLTSLSLSHLNDDTSRAMIKDRLAAIRADAIEEEDGCFTIEKTPHDREYRVTGKCPLDCPAIYHKSHSSSGHCHVIRLCVMFTVLTLDQSEYQGFLQGVDKLQVSHYCCCEAARLCIEPSHFGMETFTQNLVRKKHHNGNALCKCKIPCRTNGKHRKVLDHNGLHIGWQEKDKRPAKKARQRR